MFLAISDFYFPGSIALLVLLVLTVFRHIQAKKQQSDELIYQEEIRKKELTRIVETREERSNDQKFSEERFWKMIDDTTSRAKKGYTFQLGVLRDKLSNLDKDELIELDNLCASLIEDNINLDLTAATAIIFGDGSAEAAVLLMNLFIMQGEVFFKNACHNPNLIIGKSINAVEGRTIQDLIADLYFKKTGTLIPLRPDKDEEGFKIPGEPWKQQELPSKFPELWKEFA
jgi:hypothetical protein